MNSFKIVISPAKSMDFETKIHYTKFSTPLFLHKSSQINEVLKQKSPKQLMDLMEISEKLADLNWTRNQEWTTENTLDNAKQAIFAFTGEVYQGINVQDFTTHQLDILQDKLRILSGLYGILKPLDLIKPHRLEMGTAIKIKQYADLYHFWKSTITHQLNNELSKNEVLINLASQEYFKAIDKKTLQVKHIITPEFKDFKNGELKMIAFFAKKARGLMVRFIVQNNISSVEDLKGFNSDGYAFNDSLSTPQKLIFTR